MLQIVRYVRKYNLSTYYAMKLQNQNRHTQISCGSSMYGYTYKEKQKSKVKDKKMGQLKRTKLICITMHDIAAAEEDTF
ncbi:hypothetical protein TSUD_254150 [Trifolium subterraneum]|uniref:Uncharacterized protein n=1 Tax=Trifolium subterraneum TaxID=3900 RepID=A0A2Z6NIU3_TRISU|nr:hypothetical protein TSUD_254150 [Trifolium subterraneum]